MIEIQSATGTKFQEIAVWLLCMHCAHHSLSSCGWQMSKDRLTMFSQDCHVIGYKKAQTTHALGAIIHSSPYTAGGYSLCHSQSLHSKKRRTESWLQTVWLGSADFVS